MPPKKQVTVKAEDKKPEPVETKVEPQVPVEVVNKVESETSAEPEQQAEISNDEPVPKVTSGKNSAKSTAKGKTSTITKSSKVIEYSPNEDPVTEVHGDHRDVHEVYMGRRGIKNIHPNFRKLVNLEVLWLNDNKVSNYTYTFQP
jgi:hypothetical protein